MAKDIRVEHHQDKDITALVPQARVTQVHHLQDLKAIQGLGLRLDRDMEVQHLRVMAVHHLHSSRAMEGLHHHNKEGMVEGPQLMLKYSNGSTPWIKTEVGRLILRSSRERLSMETGVISVKRRVG